MCIKIVGPPWIATSKGSSLKIFLRINRPPPSWWRWSHFWMLQKHLVYYNHWGGNLPSVWPGYLPSSNKSNKTRYFLLRQKGTWKFQLLRVTWLRAICLKPTYPTQGSLAWSASEKNVGAKKHGFFTQKCWGEISIPFRNHIYFRLWLLGKQGITHVTLYQLCRVLFFGVFSSFFP